MSKDFYYPVCEFYKNDRNMSCHMEDDNHDSEDNSYSAML